MYVRGPSNSIVGNVISFYMASLGFIPHIPCGLLRTTKKNPWMQIQEYNLSNTGYIQKQQEQRDKQNLYVIWKKRKDKEKLIQELEDTDMVCVSLYVYVCYFNI